MILFFYVIKDFFRYVLGTLFLCVFLFVLFDFIHKTTKYFARYEPSTEHVIRFYFYQGPSLIIQALPIAALIASVVCMVILNRNNEVTAMRAAGMGPIKVGFPIACGGFTLSLLSIILGEVTLPETAKRVHYIQKVLIEKQSPNQIVDGARWIRDGNVLYNFRDYDAVRHRMDGIKVIETGANFRPKRSIEAKHGRYQQDKDNWILSGVKVFYFWPNGTLSYSEERETYDLVMPVEPKKLKKERRLPNELSVRELSVMVDRGMVTGIDVEGLRVDMHVKFAFHFASFVVCLIGLRFGYRSERSTETARGILLAIAVGVSYWFFLNAGRALGKRGHLPPFFGAWLANVLIFAYSMISIISIRKSES